MLAVIGSKPVSEGVRLAIAHIDSPRLDLKPNPLFESDEIAMFKTHYYGGIKKYQWTTIPLAMHGVIFLADGSKLEVRIGEEEGDRQFCITDLLPHLGYEQEKKPLGSAIPGENLNILVGSLSINDDKGSDLVKLNTLRLLNEKYGLVEVWVEGCFHPHIVDISRPLHEVSDCPLRTVGVVYLEPIAAFDAVVARRL